VDSTSSSVKLQIRNSIVSSAAGEQFAQIEPRMNLFLVYSFATINHLAKNDKTTWGKQLPRTDLHVCIHSFPSVKEFFQEIFRQEVQD